MSDIVLVSIFLADEPPLLISNCSPTSSDNFPSIFEAIEAGDACAVQQFIIDLGLTLAQV